MNHTIDEYEFWLPKTKSNSDPQAIVLYKIKEIKGLDEANVIEDEVREEIRFWAPKICLRDCDFDQNGNVYSFAENVLFNSGKDKYIFQKAYGIGWDPEFV